MKLNFNFIFNMVRGGGLLLALLALPAAAQQSPYFVTYDDHMEEPGNLELGLLSTTGIRGNGQPAFFAPYTELEYGVKAWWTAELYLEGQSTLNDSTIFTGWRLENRWRPLSGQHFINPVLYFEYENLNEGSRIKKEVVGHAGPATESNAELRREHVHEVEAKLILSSQVKGWNISENFIVEKNLSANEGVEFGYAVGVGLLGLAGSHAVEIQLGALRRGEGDLRQLVRLELHVVSNPYDHCSGVREPSSTVGGPR
ncbi:MAG: hypothetical protein ACREIY_01060 [Candidatus Rokuibacteriota bacterium]